MPNPNPPPPPESGQFSSTKPHPNPGRTPTKWLRDFLNAARDKTPEGKTRRQEIAERLFQIAMSDSLTGNGGVNYKDSVAAIELIFHYDMGKPIESVEMSSPDGSMSGPRVLVYLPDNGRGPQKAPPEQPSPDDAGGPDQSH